MLEVKATVRQAGSAGVNSAFTDQEDFRILC